MEIQIFSDYACPFCYTGEVRLKKAIEELGLKDVDFIYRSFQLDPLMRDDIDMNPIENLAHKYSMPLEEAREMVSTVINMAKSEGLDYDYENMKERNTLKAHRLMHFAKEKGFEDDLNQLLFKAYFEEAKDLADNATLLDLGEKAGLDPVDLGKVLDSDLYSDRVERDQDIARQYGVESVPFFIIDNELAIQGAQPIDLFLKALRKDTSL